jgi:hypothetical protein
MNRIKSIWGTLIVTVVLAALTLTAVSAAPRAADGRVEFDKETSNSTPSVGQAFSFTLRFGLASGEGQPIRVRVVDLNPAPAYLQIVESSITGGAWYSSTIDAVVWEDMLVPGSGLTEVTFDVQVTGIPASAVADGHPVTNVATMIDLAAPGSLPEQTAQVGIRIEPMKALLPLIARNYGG